MAAAKSNKPITYDVISPLRADRAYKIGETIDMAPSEAAELVAAGVLVDPNAAVVSDDSAA